MKKGLLHGTNTLVIGPMESDPIAGKKIRSKIKKELKKINITVWDHYARPFLDEIEENEKTHLEMVEARERGDYDFISNKKDIRRQDLNLVDICDFIICVFEKKTFTTGTFEELFLANSLRKPIFFVWEEGKNKCPLWIFWTIPHHFIYSSVDEALETIKKINNKEIKIDSKRWRLKKYEYR